MDNLTHTLVGLMMARCGLGKTTARGTGMMMLAANAPDIDAVTWFSQIDYLDYHRSYTHAFAFAPVMALLPMALARVRFSWKSYMAAIVGVLSHHLLDWTNPFGIQLYLPFSRERFMLDITNIIDPWIWLILLLGVAAPALAGLVGKEIRGGSDSGLSRTSGLRFGWAVFTLIALTGYEGLRFASHERAVAIMASHLYEGSPPSKVLAVPIGVNPFVWRGVVQGSAHGNKFVRVLPVRVTGVFDPNAGRTFYESPPGPAVEAARRTHEFQVFERFTRAPFWRTTPTSGGTEVMLLDLRFGDPGSPGFAMVRAVVNAAGEVVR
jgi:inner membrane protein